MTAAFDERMMRIALGLAERGLGRVAPNPAVGCIIVDELTGIIVGRGWTQPSGRPHAEAEAIARAGEAAKGATAYVTLEPCAHTGKTPPCAQALIDAGVSRVVGAFRDPDPRVAGSGYAMLVDAGIEVVDGVLAAEAARVNEGFLTRVSSGRPMVSVKLASSLDGRTATHSGHSQWITGERARNRAHLMRARTDAIMVGSATAIVDDPDLTCRLPGLGDRSPRRIVADGRLRLPLTSKLVRSARDVPVWILTLPDGDTARRQAFEDCGVVLLDVPAGPDGTMDMSVALSLLGERGITRLMVEGGSRLVSSLMRADLVDRLDWFQAPKIIGGDGYPALAGLGIDTVDEAPGFELLEVLSLGEDTLQSFSVKR
ncbi:bifunctional diaminohydroxyphosphoribosylaminopyrimidine deaminase/5-amino-6-(5-phosphoribosylamino)uracil reductase RibD [Parvibaculaceae bacterium PLY_AMNH_Bact1]|nr:bifunctional diaminohydroxyphosphoribosylaminopyrimidine deaminase/5-amino-6-(5-phosphoribosylamino)uracil reductase RibD [Parvibaculaceae bacterium PLY_AMNH_Bact1]